MDIMVLLRVCQTIILIQTSIGKEKDAAVMMAFLQFLLFTLYTATKRLCYMFLHSFGESQHNMPLPFAPFSLHLEVKNNRAQSVNFAHTTKISFIARCRGMECMMAPSSP